MEFKKIKPRETFHFNPPIQVEVDWILGSIDWEVYISFFNITEKFKKFKLYKFPDEKAGGISFEKLRDEIERDLGNSDITATDLQDEIITPIITIEYREQVSKRMKDDKYMLISSMYVDSMFQDIESFLRTEIDLVEDDVRLVLDEHNSSFITYELQPCIYTFEDDSEALYNLIQPEYELNNKSVDIEYDDIRMKTKLVVRPGIIAIRFDEQSLFSTILGFTPHWVYKHYNKKLVRKL